MAYTTIATATPSGGILSTTINLSGSTDIPNVSSWLWDYDDGSPTATGQVTTHQYSSAGTYNPFVVASGVGAAASGLASGVYLETYIVDDFGDGVGASGFDPLWDPEFTGITIGNCSGYYAFLGANGNTALIPSGSTATITGRFDLQWDWCMGCTNGGNTSLHFYLKDAGDNTIHHVNWNGGLQYSGVNIGIASAWSAGRRYTVRMLRGYQLDVSGNVTPDSPDVIHDYYLDNWSGGASNEWREYPQSPSSGTQYTDDFYIDINHATYNGYDNFILQAEGGLPYSGGITHAPRGTGTATVIISGVEYPVSGYVAGVGRVYGNRQIIYKATPAPPSGSPIGTYTPILMNKRRYVYKIGGDQLQTKLMLYKGKHLQYLPNLDAELWLNYQGSWQKYEDYTTNRYGMAHMKHSTDGIPDIDCCLGIARVTINGQIYNSNIVRFNFVEGVLGTYEIDAGTCIPCSGVPCSGLDRSAYDLFDGSGRANSYDRMWR